MMYSFEIMCKKQRQRWKCSNLFGLFCNNFKNFDYIIPVSSTYMEWFLMVIINGFMNWMTTEIKLSLITSWDPFSDILTIARNSHRRCSIKELFLKFYNILKTLTKVFSCEYCKIFRNTYSGKHLQTAAFDTVTRI